MRWAKSLSGQRGGAHTPSGPQPGGALPVSPEVSGLKPGPHILPLQGFPSLSGRKQQNTPPGFSV